MGRICYKDIADKNRTEWKALTENPQKYEALLAGHYSDRNHFVYELLQNAEDEGAKTVYFAYYPDKLIFYHDGKPFNEDDVYGVCSILEGTKSREDAQTIGHFGMGFKSVFNYTSQPIIYSDSETFMIQNYLLPVEVEEHWDDKKERSELRFAETNEKQIFPFQNSEHLTKIVIPFAKINKKREIEPVDGSTVLEKFKEFSGDLLLFLRHIRNLYWIDTTSDAKAYIAVKENGPLVTCSISGITDDKPISNRYLRYKQSFDCEDMKDAEVSVAYRLKAKGKGVDSLENAPIWVFFPTGDRTKLPFLIHGSFETAVSREKLMFPSKFNEHMFDQLGDLIADSMADLAKRKLITQSFLREIVLPAFQDNTIIGLKEKITEQFRTKRLLPTRSGEYCAPNEMRIALPDDLAFKTGSGEYALFESFYDELYRLGIRFADFTDDNKKNFTEYYRWLSNDLQIAPFDLLDWANGVSKLPEREISSKQQLEALGRTYEILRQHTLYPFFSYPSQNDYENAVKKRLVGAWEELKSVPIILNCESKLVPPFRGKVPAIYIRPTSRYATLPQSAVVHQSVEKYVELFKWGFDIQEYDNQKFIIETVFPKYKRRSGACPRVEEKEHIEDIRRLLDLAEEIGKKRVAALLEEEEIYIIRAIDKPGKTRSFRKPGEVYYGTSKEDVDFEIYYASADGLRMGKYPLDDSFYRNNGVSIDGIKSLGLATKIVDDGLRVYSGHPGCSAWEALGDFCPKIKIDKLKENLYFISSNPNSDLAKGKSAVILRLLLSISSKLSGQRRYRKTNPYEKAEDADCLSYIKGDYQWLFDEDGKLRRTNELSRFELNHEVYRDLPDGEEAYRTLGFVEKEIDKRKETLIRVKGLGLEEQRALLLELVHELGEGEKESVIQQLTRTLGLNERKELITSLIKNTGYCFDFINGASDDDVFDVMAQESDDFPQRYISDTESLRKYIEMEFLCADPVKYEERLRSIRTSKCEQKARAYIFGMYTNRSGAKLCQMCRKIVKNPRIVEIANFGIEMSQLHLCLCYDCEQQYKSKRDNNRDSFKSVIAKRIQELGIDDLNESYAIVLDDQLTLYFTQTHLAEIQEILSLLDQYGTPESSKKPQ